MHHIRRQTFEIKFSSQEKGFDLQTRFTELMHDALLPVIEEVFTQVSLPNVILRLDTLDINLGEISLDSLEQDLPDILRNKLTDALLAAIGEIRYFPKETSQLVAKEKADIELLIYFLQNGTLPWWSSHPRQEDFSLSDLLEQCLASQPGSLITNFQQELKTPEVRLRLTKQFPDELLFKILSIAIPARLQFVKSFLTGLSQFQQAKKVLEITPALFREMSWDFIWTFVFLHRHTSFEESAFAEGIFNHISGKLDLPMPRLLLAIASSPGFEKNISTNQSSVQMLAGRILTEHRLRRPEEFTQYFQQNNNLRFAGMQNESERFVTLVQVAEPALASTIENLAKLLAQIFEQAATGTSVNEQTINRVIRESVIHYLFAEKHPAFSIPSYLKSSLPLLVNKLNIPPEQVLASLANAGSEAKSIQQIFRQLLEEYPQILIRNSSEPPSGKLSQNKNDYARLILDGQIRPPVRYSDLDILRFFLQYGVIPWTERIRHTPDLIKQLVTEMIQTQPEQLDQWIQSSGLLNQPVVVQRIQAQFSPELVARFLQKNSQTALTQPSLLSIEELTAQPDVIVHYLWAYLDTGKLPAEVPVSVHALIHTFIIAYPEISREFISTLPEAQQQVLLDISLELVTFLASEPGATNAGTSNEENASETDNKAEPRQSLSEEEQQLNKTNAQDKDNTTFIEQPVLSSDELMSTQEIQSKKLLEVSISDASEQPLELPADLPDTISSKPMQIEIDKPEASPGQITAKETDTGKEIKNNESSTPDLAKKEKLSTNIQEDSYQSELKNKNQETDSRKPEISPVDDLQHISPEEQTNSRAKIYSSIEPEDNQTIVQTPTKAPEMAPDGMQIPLPDQQMEQDKKSIPGKSIPKKPQDSSKRYIWRQPEEPLYIRNAGLVLIHPFLTRFFTLLKLTVNKKFIDEQAAQRGVHLLHYISHKSEGAPEYELALNKVLCGLPVSMPLEKEVELTEEEKETCESLIQGVIQNWTILKNTSPDNFRVSFLHREGRLVYTSEDWQLKVENRGYDILIDKLPWTYSIIKLPWMEKVLRVEWR
ncbi:hypothetical protein GXP67_28330 [Rhodocytophaga rosea]|uniref:Uncharacterized protein n=1 Tax=Rhodocytophaga rosea TaxID=2704465 RepID=A0A6C0GS17_9BACT|nr:contractile injection system tape measure protein [Rhodocytophaga rosea]QHT70280.1 hypothetical protein GXP67_28330 [Rhodocytophaga rosea]